MITRARLRTFARWYAAATIVGWCLFLAFVIGATGADDARAATTTGAAATTAAATTPPADAPPIELEQRRSAPQTTERAVAETVMCPSCDTTLDQSNSPAADRMRAYVVAAVAAGWTKSEIREGLVEEYGGDESILATPRAHGLGLLAWLVPALVALLAVVAGVLLTRQWRAAAGRSQWSSSSTSSSYASEPSKTPSVTTPPSPSPDSSASR